METDQDRELVAIKDSAAAPVSDGARQSELMVACATGHLALVKRLLAAGADPNGVNAFGETPLTYAVAAGRQAVVRYLLAKGANVELPARPGWGPLMYAAASGNHRILMTLIEQGADLSRQDVAGRSAALVARERGHFRCAATLGLRLMLTMARACGQEAKPRAKGRAAGMPQRSRLSSLSRTGTA
jgi:ankyrin repeat protein